MVSAAPPFASLPPGREALAVPVTMGGEVVAVLYADQGASEGDGKSSPWRDSVELVARHAARCLEAWTALKAARALSERPQLDMSGSRPAVSSVEMRSAK